MKNFWLILAFLLIATSSIKASEINASPTLTIATLDGNNFDLKEKHGKVIIINFWAKWCGDCHKEILILDEIYREYKSRGLEIIGVNIGRKRERKKVAEISSSLSYPNAMFYEAKESSFEEPNTIPLSYVIDKNGKLITKITHKNSKLTKADFEKILEPLL